MIDSGFVFWCLAAMVTLIHLNRWLAAQNVFAVAAIVGGLGAALAMLLNSGARHESNGLIPPFSPRWNFPPFWIAAVLSSRAVTRLIHSRCARPPNSGSGTLAFAAALISVFAWSSRRLADPGIAGDALRDFHAAWLGGLRFLGWAAASWITLVLIAPWLINKRSTQEDHGSSSLVIWLLPGLYLVARLMQRQSWIWATILVMVIVAITVQGIQSIRLRATGPISPHAG